jgi:alpha-tubulin suppressor-like RCC1 family protein
VFGSSSDGLLALGGNFFHVFQPTEVNLPLAFGREQIASISIGETHGIALTASGRAFSWGKSAHEALGQQSKRYIPIPQPVLVSHKKPKSARASDALCLKLARHLRGDTDTSASSKKHNSIGPKEAISIDPSPVAYVHAGSDMSVFILRSGSIQTCGRQSGRLGQGDVSSNVSTSTEIFGGMQLWRSGRTST